MEFETFVRAVLDTHFTETKDEIIESAAKAICNYTGQPIVKNESKTIQFSKPKFKDEEEIIVGDEIKSLYDNIFGVVTKVNSITGHIRVLFRDGSGMTMELRSINYIKTGRHFDELQQLLDKMKE